MAIELSCKTQINRSAAEVADYMFTPANDPQWINGVRSSILQTDFLEVGSTILRNVYFLGKEFEYTLRVLQYEQSRLLIMRAMKGPFPMLITYEIISQKNKTQLSVEIKANTLAFYGISDAVLGPMIEKSTIVDLKKLKDIIESL